jgi:hypothetical protein
MWMLSGNAILCSLTALPTIMEVNLIPQILRTTYLTYSIHPNENEGEGAKKKTKQKNIDGPNKQLI